MNAAHSDLGVLAGHSGDAARTVSRPRGRWRTRLVLPLLIFGGVGGLFVYAARGTFGSRVDVWVVPVVAKQGAAQGEAAQAAAPGAVVAQAPGWIEPAPYPVTVPALTGGVVREVLVLEGDPVEAGQVVARMVDDDARLTLRSAEAELAERRAEVERARASVGAAEFLVEELRDDVERKRSLVPVGGVAAGEFTRVELRLRAAEQEVVAARAGLSTAEAAVRTQEVKCEEAALDLDRTQIRSPSEGVVLSRHVEPGTRIHLSERSSGDGLMGAVLRIYDPARLQVRADVPLADAAKISVGMTASITTEALSDGVLEGEVTRIVHEADIQRNTVPVKVLIKDPPATLKPEMLARVRFMSKPGGAAPATTSPGLSDVRLLLPSEALLDATEDKAAVWLVDAGNIVERRAVAVGPPVDGLVLVSAGLNPGDRVVIDAPSGLSVGSRVRILGEKPAMGGVR
jgi:RND family efflux transporter MFP subunit